MPDPRPKDWTHRMFSIAPPWADWKRRTGWRRNLWLRWLAFCRWRWGTRLGFKGATSTFGTMLPVLGKGEFVSVVRHGDFIDLTDERSGERIRLIPYQPNHGVMVEKWNAQGKLSWRLTQGFNALSDLGDGFGERGSA